MDDPSGDGRPSTICPGQSRLRNIHDSVVSFPIHAYSKPHLIGQLFHPLFDRNPQMIMRPVGQFASVRTGHEVNFANYPKCEFLSIRGTLSYCDYPAKITC